MSHHRDPEKAEQAEDATSDTETSQNHSDGHIQRPASVALSDSTSESKHELDDIHGDDDEGDEKHNEKNHHHRRRGRAPAANVDDIVPAVTVGEPAGTPCDVASTKDLEAAKTRTSHSRASSTRSRPLSIVPRSKRRGLFGRFAMLPEVERPYDYKNSTKWGITFVVSIATAAAPMGSSIFYPALPLLARELDASVTITNLSVALYMIAMSIFPLWWSALSEQFGRRTIYLISFTLFLLFSILCAVSVNMPMLVVFRLGSGGASASVQAVGAGTIADIWESHERGRAMGIFYLGPLLGPLIAPIVGGILAQELGWQSTMWFLAIFGLIILLMIFFALPETLAQQQRVSEQTAPTEVEELRRTTTTESAKVKTKKFAKGTKKYLIDPLSVLLILRFPPVLITVMIAAIAFGSLFILNIAIQQDFSKAPYSFNELIVGLLYIPPGLGYFSASFFGGKWLDSIMKREAKKANRYDEQGRLIYLPEDRFRENAWIANTGYPLSMLVFGWTLGYGIHWMVPSVAAFFFGLFSMLIFAASTTMLTEFVRKKSSAGVAVNNFVRNILSCVGSVVAAPWISAIGSGWVFTILTFVCLLVGYSGIWMLRQNAQRWRIAMDEALAKI